MSPYMTKWSILVTFMDTYLSMLRNLNNCSLFAIGIYYLYIGSIGIVLGMYVPITNYTYVYGLSNFNDSTYTVYQTYDHSVNIRAKFGRPNNAFQYLLPAPTTGTIINLLNARVLREFFGVSFEFYLFCIWDSLVQSKAWVCIRQYRENGPAYEQIMCPRVILLAQSRFMLNWKASPVTDNHQLVWIFVVNVCFLS